MSVEREVICPVCRAKQRLPAHVLARCRRCEADLALYLKALHSLQVARQRTLDADASGDSQLSHAAVAYLRWLSPNAVVCK
jgi:hypothetical protein